METDRTAVPRDVMKKQSFHRKAIAALTRVQYPLGRHSVPQYQQHVLKTSSTNSLSITSAPQRSVQFVTFTIFVHLLPVLT